MSDTLLPHKPLTDRIAVVTGASRGIGRAAALALFSLAKIAFGAD